MPQLDPTPWFPILVFSWLVFLSTLLPKIVKFTFPNNPAPMNTRKPGKQPSNW